MTRDPRISRLREAREDIRRARRIPDTPQTLSPAYRLAFKDEAFLQSEPMRGVRLQLELSKVEMELEARGITSTVVLFGSARIPAPGAEARSPELARLAPYYEMAREFARAVTERSLDCGCRENVVCTGGGPGIMEAGNRGAEEAGGCSIGLNIVLPHEQAPNRYVTPELSFNFHYFAIRKMHFLMRARVIAVFPGGFGTLDEMFEAITLIQTGRMRAIPIILLGRAFWNLLVNWQALVEAGTIAEEDLKLLHFVDTVEEALAIFDACPG